MLLVGGRREDLHEDIPRRREDMTFRDLTILGRQRDGQNKLLQINGSKDSSSYIINRMNLIQF
jgi:hypothetical protein